MELAAARSRDNSLTYEFRCEKCGAEQERYVPRFASPNPPCEDAACDGETVKLVSGFAIIFTGPLTARYNDRNLEGAHSEGHWATRLRTVSGEPEPVWIDSWQAQREFCKSEGLVNPKDLPSNAEASSDRKLSGSGMKGQWI